MRFRIGQEVYLLRTGEFGEVAEFCDESSCYVEVDGDEIPVYYDDLIPAEEAESYISGIEEDDLTEETTEETTEVAHFDGRQLEFPNLNGIYLYFVRKSRKEKKYPDFRIFLVNRLNSDLQCVYSLLVDNKKQSFEGSSSRASSEIELPEINYHDILGRPAFAFQFTQESPEKGTQPEFECILKPNAQKLTSLFTPLLQDTNAGAVLMITNKLPLLVENKEKLGRAGVSWPKHFEEVDTNPIKAFAEDTIDLHIEKLKKDHSRLSNSEIVEIQMRAYRNFMDSAIRHGLERVFVIHGVGKGVLKNMIHEELRRNPEVLNYINEYHPKFGYGATEIEL